MNFSFTSSSFFTGEGSPPLEFVLSKVFNGGCPSSGGEPSPANNIFNGGDPHLCKFFEFEIGEENLYLLSPVEYFLAKIWRKFERHF